MSSTVFYVTMYIVSVLIIYTVLLLIGVYRTKKTYKLFKNNESELSSILFDIKGSLDILKEDSNMEEKNLPQNDNSLTDLLEGEPTDKGYEEVVTLLEILAYNTYKDYKFLIAKSSDETQRANFLQIVHNYYENPKVHDLVFRKSIDYSLDQRELQKRFAKKVAKGEVIDLGENVTVITEDGTNQVPTGVSPIDSGIEGGEITFIISFVKTENYDEWRKNNIESEDNE